MTAGTPTGTLSDRANLLLSCLHEHHLLTTRQLQQLLLPTGRLRGMQKLLALLVQRGLVASVGHKAGRRNRQRVWYLTPAGVDVVQAVPGTRPSRSKPLTRQLAEGQLQHHTLAVNDVGIAFVQAARQRGDDCGPLGWQHEVVHRAGTRRTDVVISDAVLRYQRHPDQGFSVTYRFIELDRSTTPVERLQAKLENYARAASYTAQGAKREEWRERYLALPEVLLVLTGAPPGRLERRAANLVALCKSTPTLGDDPVIPISICQLSELTEHGPHAAIFTRLGQPETQCDWRGEGGRA
ncbi:hypothetical protein DSM112329_00794 [Paraconexibacter sp. AEG42_29]|uniref:Replication-relaxation n=1 Tax=Paraconexibacter sp. AEG42_29 TaxID=2997339 RepID=A0AAU7ARH3_9ACTN